ncbi:MAG: hypothetical protein M3282_12990 [Gemmatimonadota bacterium]|nr:hypothetical protein [Gemmatimonadota bacterium]
MDTIGLDLHKRESQLCILGEDGRVTERRIVTSRERFTAVLGTRPPAQVLLEASTESECVARPLEALGHAVIVADPNYAPMYATRSRRVKTDRRDARTTGAASASQLMAQQRRRRDRELVGAARSTHDPDAPRPVRLTDEREQKAEQHLEQRADNRRS